MRYVFHTLDVFTRQIFGGNPLAVLPDARGLSETQMRAIAREFNLSETVFVLPPDHPTHARRLRIFTPTGELPFAGHPTLGAAWLLAALGAIPVREPATALMFEEGVGPVAVEIAIDRSQPTFARLTAAQLPLQGPEPPEASRRRPGAVRRQRLGLDGAKPGTARGMTASLGVLSEPTRPGNPPPRAAGEDRAYTRVTVTGTGRQMVLQTGECCWA